MIIIMVVEAQVLSKPDGRSVLEEHSLLKGGGGGGGGWQTERNSVNQYSDRVKNQNKTHTNTHTVHTCILSYTPPSKG